MNYITICPASFDPAECSDEFIAEYCRVWRNRELANSDWTQLPDVDLPNKWDWAVYRQQLRDMMQQYSDPKLIVLPTRPK